MHITGDRASTRDSSRTHATLVSCQLRSGRGAGESSEGGHDAGFDDEQGNNNTNLESTRFDLLAVDLS